MNKNEEETRIREALEKQYKDASDAFEPEYHKALDDAHKYGRGILKINPYGDIEHIPFEKVIIK